MCYHAEFGRSALNGVGIIQKNHNNWGALELRSLGMGGVADPKIHAPPQMCYHVKFGSSATNSVCINRKEHPKFESAGTLPFWGGRG